MGKLDRLIERVGDVAEIDRILRQGEDRGFVPPTTSDGRVDYDALRASGNGDWAMQHGIDRAHVEAQRYERARREVLPTAEEAAADRDSVVDARTAALNWQVQRRVLGTLGAGETVPASAVGLGGSKPADAQPVTPAPRRSRPRRGLPTARSRSTTRPGRNTRFGR